MSHSLYFCSFCIERLRQILRSPLAFNKVNGQHIEAARPRVWVGKKVTIRSANDASNLSWCQRFQSAEVRPRPSELDLYETKGVGFARNDIDFSTTDPIVPFDNSVATQTQPAQRTSFSCAAFPDCRQPT